MVHRRTPKLVPEEKTWKKKTFNTIDLSTLRCFKWSLGFLLPTPPWLGWFNTPETSQQKAAAPERRCGDTSRHHRPCQWGAPHGSSCSPSLRQLVELLEGKPWNLLQSHTTSTSDQISWPMVHQFFHEVWNDEDWATINEAKTEGKLETNQINIVTFSTRVLDCCCFKHVTSFNSISFNSYEKVSMQNE